MAADNKIIFSLVDVGKTYPPKRKVLQNIYLSFFYGEKIGVIGLNASGKSTLLKIIAGMEQPDEGEVTFSKGYSVGMLEQEPKLDDAKTVKEIVQEGMPEVMNLLKQYEDINNRFSEPMDGDEMEKLIKKQGEVQELIDNCNGWEMESTCAAWPASRRASTSSSTPRGWRSQSSSLCCCRGRT